MNKMLETKAPVLPNPFTVEAQTTPKSEPLPYSTEGLTTEQIEILQVWEDTKREVTRLKAYELELRRVIVYEGGFFNPNKTSGTEHAALADGFKLTAVKIENYTLNNDDGETDEALTHFTDDLAALLVNWKPTLSVSTFKKLTPEQQAFFNDALEIKSGAPSLEIKSPKTKA